MMEEILDFTIEQGLKYERTPNGEYICIYKEYEGGYVRIMDIGGQLYSTNVSGRFVGILNKYGVKILTELYFRNRS